MDPVRAAGTAPDLSTTYAVLLVTVTWLGLAPVGTVRTTVPIPGPTTVTGPVSALVAAVHGEPLLAHGEEG